VITNENLYGSTASYPVTEFVQNQRWNTFGNILRGDKEIPAYQSMRRYYETRQRKRGKMPMMLPQLLHEDTKKFDQNLKTIADFEAIAETAQDIAEWNRRKDQLKQMTQAKMKEDNIKKNRKRFEARTRRRERFQEPDQDQPENIRGPRAQMVTRPTLILKLPKRKKQRACTNKRRRTRVEARTNEEQDARNYMFHRFEVNQIQRAPLFLNFAHLPRLDQAPQML